MIHMRCLWQCQRFPGPGRQVNRSGAGPRHPPLNFLHSCSSVLYWLMERYNTISTPFKHKYSHLASVKQCYCYQDLCCTLCFWNFSTRFVWLLLGDHVWVSVMCWRCECFFDGSRGCPPMYVHTATQSTARKNNNTIYLNKFKYDPALSLVPDIRAPPKGCWPTTAPVGLSLI